MGQARIINETLVANVALLAGGTCCLLGGPLAVGVFGVLAAPAVGIGGWGLKKWFDRLSNKNPESHKAIRRIQNKVNETLRGDVEFANADPEDLAEADNQLSKLVAQFWPSPKIIAELATEIDGFPDAIAGHVMDEINGSAFATGLFEKPPILAYAKRVLSLSLEAALTDRAYFETLEPQLFMKNLNLTGQIGRDVKAFTQDLAKAQNVVSEALERIEGKLDDANGKLDFLIDQLVPKTGASEEENKNIRQTIVEMLLSDRQASKDAADELMAEPARPAAATNRLKQAIAEQGDARKEATRNEIALLEEIVAINYFNNGPEAVAALKSIVELSPNDAHSWNRLGHLQKRLGALDEAIKAYQMVARIGKATSDKSLEAVAYGNLGIVAHIRGDLDDALAYYEQALEINTELNDKEGMANVYGNLGNVRLVRGDLDGAVTYYEQSLAIETELGRKEGMAIAYGNLGIVARERGDLDAAVAYYEQSLEIEKKLGRREGMANQYGNLGTVAATRGDLEGAVGYYQQALALNKDLGRKEGMANAYGNLGIVAETRGDLDGALAYYEQALELNMELGRKEGMAIDYGNLGNVAQKRGDLDGAVAHYEQALALNTELGSKEGMANQYGNLGVVAQIRGDLDDAVAYYEQALAIETELGRKEGMATDYANMGLLEETRGNLSLARSHWEIALDLFTQVGAAPQIATVTGWLKDLDEGA